MTDQASPPTPGQAAPLPPDHWLLLGHSAAWLAAARALLDCPQHPMLAWRVRFGLVQVASADSLATALRQALQRAPGRLSVVHEPGGFGNIDALLAQALAAAAPALPGPPAPQVLILSLSLPGPALALAMMEPDGLAAELWLHSGRRMWPVIGHPLADPAMTPAADAAFRHWARAYQACHAAQDLDDIYGTGPSRAAPAKGPLQDQGPPATRPPLVTLPARPWVNQAALPLAAAASGSGGRAWRREGRLNEPGASGPRDAFWLSAKTPILRGGEAGALTVDLRLDQRRWAGRRQLQLELHAPRHAPLLLPLGDVAAATVRQGQFAFTQQCHATPALLAALDQGAELLLTYQPPAEATHPA